MPTFCPHCGKQISPKETTSFSESEIARFWNCVDKQDNGCWIFKRGGPVYGRINMGGRQQVAHRISWIIHNGRIPEGIMVLHDCPSGDNPRCVNPDHLFLGTVMDNVRDMISKRRNNPPIGTRNHLAKLTPEKVLQIRDMVCDGIKTIDQVAKDYGLSFQAVYHVVRGSVWKSVGGPLIEKRKSRRLSVDEVIEIRRMAAEGCKQSVIMEKFGLLWQGTVSQIVCGRKRRDVPMDAHLPLAAP